MEIKITTITENGEPVDLTDVEVKFYCGEKDITPKNLLVEGNTMSWNSDELKEDVNIEWEEMDYKDVPMGAQYQVLEQEFKRIDGKLVRIIKKVRIISVSLTGKLCQLEKFRQIE